MRRLLAVLTASAVAATVPMILSPAEAAGRYAVTAFASTAKVDVGQGFTLRGKVTPRASGQKVKVQRLVGSTWTTVTRATLNRRSKYTATIKVTAPGDNRYRVVKPKSAGHKKGVSATVTVVGWRWRPISGLPLYTGPGSSSVRTTHLASGVLFGSTYSPFIQQSGTGGTFAVQTYRLDGACTRLHTVVGGAAGSEGPDESNVWLLGSLASDPGSFTEGLLNALVASNRDPLLVQRGPADITGLFALEVSANGIEAGNFVGWGDARVYCRS